MTTPIPLYFSHRRPSTTSDSTTQGNSNRGSTSTLTPFSIQPPPITSRSNSFTRNNREAFVWERLTRLDGNRPRAGNLRASVLSFGAEDFPRSPSGTDSSRRSTSFLESSAVKGDRGDEEGLILRVERLESVLATIIEQKKQPTFVLSPEMLLREPNSIMTRRRFVTRRRLESIPHHAPLDYTPLTLSSPSPSNGSVHLPVPVHYTQSPLLSNPTTTSFARSTSSTAPSFSARLSHQLDSKFHSIIALLKRISSHDSISDSRGTLNARRMNSDLKRGRIFGVRVDRNIVGMSFGAPLYDPNRIVEDVGIEDDDDPVTGTNCQMFLPLCARRCLEYLDKIGVHEEGIYRVPGRRSEILQLRILFDAGADLNFSQMSMNLDPHTVCSLFKEWLREIPRSVAPKINALLEEALSAEVLLEKCRNLLAHSLSAESWILYRAISFHLARVAAPENDNKMSLDHLILILSPTVGLSPTVLSLLIQNRNMLLRDGNDDVRRRRTAMREERHAMIRQSRFLTTLSTTVTSFPYTSLNIMSRPFSYILVDAPYSISTLSLIDPSLSSASSMNYSTLLPSASDSHPSLATSSVTSSACSARSQPSPLQPTGFERDSPMQLLAVDSREEYEYEEASPSSWYSGQGKVLFDDEQMKWEKAREESVAHVIATPLFSRSLPDTTHRLMKKRR